MLVVLELQNVLALLRHLDSRGPTVRCTAVLLVLLENVLCRKASEAPCTVVVVVAVCVLLTVKKAAQVFDQAVV